MRYFRKVFLKKIFIAPWSMLIIWLFLLSLRAFDIILWVQGETDISILTIVMLLFTIVLVITLTIQQLDFHTFEQILAIPLAGILVSIIISVVMVNQPMTRDYYEENGQKIIVETNEYVPGITYYNFYQQNGLLAKRVANCHTYNKDNTVCTFYIYDNELVVQMTENGEIVKYEEIPLNE